MPTKGTLPSEGTLLDGRYRLIRKIASGGMGEVWQGRIEYPGGQRRSCAIKFTRPGLATGDGEAVLMREALLGFEVSENHPNLLTTRDYRDSPYGRFVVTELIEGPSLWDVADQLRGQYARLTLITERAVFALAEMHHRNVVHYDVSPANILLDRTGAVKLIDFGLSAHIVSSHRGTLRGVAAYMSPEEMGMGQGSPASDLYSLGAVIYTLITGHPPYGTGVLRDVHDRMKEPRAPLPADVPTDLARIVDGLLDPSPLTRMTAVAVLAILRDTLDPIARDEDIATIAGDWLARNGRHASVDSPIETHPRPSQEAPRVTSRAGATPDVGMDSQPGLPGVQIPADMQTDRDRGTPPPTGTPDHAAYAETPIDPGDAMAVPDMPAGAIPVRMDLLASSGPPTADELLQRWLASRNAPPPLIEAREPPPALPAVHPPPEPRPSDSRRPLANGWPIIAALLFVIGVLLARPGELVIVQAPEPEARISLPATPGPEPEARVTPPSTPVLEQPSVAELEAATTSTTSEPAETSAAPDATPSEESTAGFVTPRPRVDGASRIQDVATRSDPDDSPSRQVPDEQTPSAEVEIDMTERAMWLDVLAGGADETIINRSQCNRMGICVVVEKAVRLARGERILYVKVSNSSEEPFYPSEVELLADELKKDFAQIVRWVTSTGPSDSPAIPPNQQITAAIWLEGSARLTDGTLQLLVGEAGGGRRVAVAGIKL